MNKKTTQIVLASISFVAGLIFLLGTIALLDIPFVELSLYIAGTIFFLGVCAYLVCKILEIEIQKFVLLVVGVLGTIFAAIYFVDFLGSPIMKATKGFDNICAVLAFYAITPVVVFGLFPLFKGLHKVIGKSE